MASPAAGGAGLPRMHGDTAPRREMRRAIDTMVTETGGCTRIALRTTGRAWPGVNAIEPEPIAQIESEHPIEQAAHALIRDLIRLARQTGRTWYEIGEALDLHGDAVLAKESTADIAYAFALRYQIAHGMRTFTWTCPACQQLVTDQTWLVELPAREGGHADDCPRWAAEQAEWRRYHAGDASQDGLPARPDSTQHQHQHQQSDLGGHDG